MKVVFSDETVHGNVDGGHTLRVILENRDNVDAGKQYVKLEILTGVEGIFEDLAAARNTSTQVQDKSIANLRGYFELIKEVIATEEFHDNVYFMENDDADIDVGDILAILNLFNIDEYPVFAVMLGSGMRVGEVAGLRWCDIDLDEGIIDVNHTLRSLLSAYVCAVFRCVVFLFLQNCI